MGDALSLAANISGIIGLGDVVFRTGKELYELCSRCKNAPASRATLLAEISASTSIVAQCRIFLGECESVSRESDDSLPEIKTILILLGQEFGILRDIIRKSQAAARDGWFGQLSRNLRWAIEEPEVAQSCSRLHRLTSSMNMALSVNGRRNDLVVNRELNNTKIEVIKLVEATHDIQAAMRSLVVCPSPGRQLPKRLGKQTRASKRTPRRICENGSNAKPGLHHPDEHAGTVGASSSMTLTQDSSLGAVEMINLFEREDRSIVIASTVHRDISKSLILMRQALVNMLDGMTTRTLRMSNQNLRFISEVFDNVLARGLLSSADRLQAEAEQHRRAGLRLSVENGCLPLSEVTPTTSPWLNKHTRIAIQNQTPSDRATGRLPGAMAHVDYFHDFQSIEKESPLGRLNVELVQGGYGSLSELLISTFTFTPGPELLQPAVKFSFFSSRLNRRWERSNFLLTSEDHAPVTVHFIRPNLEHFVIYRTTIRIRRRDSWISIEVGRELYKFWLPIYLPRASLKVPCAHCQERKRQIDFVRDGIASDSIEPCSCQILAI